MIDQFFNTGLTFKYNDSTYTVQIDDKNQNIIGTFDYERYNFDFDSVYRDRNMLFTFDCNQDEFIGTGPHWHTSINNNYLRYGYQFNVAMILYWTKKSKGSHGKSRTIWQYDTAQIK